MWRASFALERLHANQSVRAAVALQMKKGAINEMRPLFTYSRGSVRQQDHEHAKLQVAAAVEAT